MSIDGKERSAVVVRDDFLEPIVKLQGHAWQMDAAVQRRNAELETMIRHGARIESDKYYWDPELRMVRSLKDRKAAHG